MRCSTTLEEFTGQFTLSSDLFKKHNTYISPDLFNINNLTLTELLNGKSVLFVLSEQVFELYGKKISHYLENNKDTFNSHLITIKSGEHNKNMQAVNYICEKAYEFSHKRQHPIVAIGGGICTDICGLAASLFRRSVPHIKIPTTFVGLIDAGIAAKNAVNLGNKKNLLGTFSPPEASLIDPTFLKSLPLRHVVCGISESLKLGLITDQRIYDLWRKFGTELLFSHIQSPSEASKEIIKRSILIMLVKLAENLYEHNTYKRIVDFGHTFSPYIEEASRYQILHGEAVAIDMAISCQISYLHNLVSKKQLDEIFTLFQTLGLPIYSTLINLDEMWVSLSSIVAHRGNQLNLVIPKGIGDCLFIENMCDLDKSCLREALTRLENYDTEYRCNAVVS